MPKHNKFAVKIYPCKSAILALILATILMLGFAPPRWRSAAAITPEIWAAHK